MLNRLIALTILSVCIVGVSNAEAALLCRDKFTMMRFISVGGTVGVIERGASGVPTVLSAPDKPPVKKTPSLWSIVYESADKLTVVELEIDVSTPENQRTATIKTLDAGGRTEIKLNECKQF